MEKPLIIFDTDMDTDCDDAGALGLILEYVKAGKAELLGVIADAPDRHVAGCCDAICRWYGLPRPVGAVRAKKYAQDPRFEAYRQHRARMSWDRFYNEPLAARVGKTDEDYPDAACAYRQLLAGAEDGSVTVVCVGFLTALAELLCSQGDDLSPLTGAELMAKKVNRVVSMGNAQYPLFPKNNFNYNMDAVGARTFFEKCPVPVYICPEGTKVITGYRFPEVFSEDHPLRMAYKAFVGKEGVGRSSWDLITSLYALEPESPLFVRSFYGTACYESPERGWWISDGKRKDCLLTLAVSNEEMALLLEEKLTK